jgi:PleD family two-component response regulator
MNDPGRIVLLIIDDNPADRVTYRRYLEQVSGDYEVHEAEDIKTGLDAVHRVKPDCVLLDLMLNHESGFELLNALIEHTSQLQLPVIMLTGASWVPLKDAAMKLGARAYLRKGHIDAAQLDRTIREVVENKLGGEICED